MPQFYQEYMNLIGVGQLGNGLTALLAVSILWSLIWKGIALWKAARLGEKYWYLAILVINSVGILEILYIFVFAKEKGVKDLKW
jgi:hypothetical protein